MDGIERCIDDEIPFEIPDNWAWTRFGTAMINRDAERIPLSVNEREKLQKVYDYYGASGVIDQVDRFIFDKPLLLIGEDGANLLTRGKPIAFIARGQYWVNNHAHVLDSVDGLLLEYVAAYINKGLFSLKRKWQLKYGIGIHVIPSQAMAFLQYEFYDSKKHFIDMKEEIETK